ncbi:hypothetical protein HPB50_027103 [Hyalomma asiaticum]|uniref:Uncharacterized protein n=1 Tax=Hyalomma asiaticum TaxID=266040 RepID=A0ACB7T4P6_HYAAI|nr:hypothetical protein HPB50_027103 [Hyalomma asiaticum]
MVHTMPPPHPGLTRSEAVTYRQLHTGSLPTPVFMKHVCSSLYVSDLCRACKSERSTAAHILWDCEQNPREAKTVIPPWVVAAAGSDQLEEQTVDFGCPRKAALERNHQAVSEDSVCLPMARVDIEGPFGTLKTVAAVSKGLPEEYPYLFSNKSESLLNEQSKSFADVEAQVLALTRSKARQLSAQLRYADKEEEPGCVRAGVFPSSDSASVEAASSKDFIGGRSLLREHGLARFSPQVAEHQAPCRRIVVQRSCLRRRPSQMTLRGRNAHRSPPANIYEQREVLPGQQRPRVSDQAVEFGPHALASWKTPAWSRDHIRRGRLRGVQRGVSPGQRREAAPEPPASSEGPGDPILDS